MKKLFLNVENKIKFCAELLAAVTIVIGVLFGLFFIFRVVYELRNPFAVEIPRALFISGIGLILFLFMSSWLIYGFAELLENAKEINRTLKAGYAERPFTDTKQQPQPKQEASIFKDAEKERQEKSNSQINSLAQANEYAKLTDVSIKPRNSAIIKKDLRYSVTNTAESTITSLFLFVLEFDKDGQPVTVTPYSSYCINGHQTGKSINLIVGETKTYLEDLFLQPNTQYVRAVVSRIEFIDKTEWINPYIEEWAIKNCCIYRA